MSVVITTYTLASGLMQQGMTWSQALVTILLGNAIVLDPDDPQRPCRHQVRRVVPGVVPRGVRRARRQHAGDPARDRRVRLVRHPDLDRRARAAGAADRGVAGVGERPGIDRDRLRDLLGGAGRDHHSRSRGHQAGSKRGRRRCCSAAARCCCGGRSPTAAGSARILSEAPKLQQGSTPFWTLFPAALTANVGYWATLSLNIPDFTRYAQSQRSQVLGQALGLPATMTAFAFLGVAVTSATIVIFGEAIWDPVVLIARIGSPMVVILGALVILAAQITTNMAANVVSPANDFSSLAPKKISYVTGGLITAALGIVMMPWKLYADASAYIFTWLIGYSSLMGAIGGILIADYWILRKRELSLPDLFKLDGRYSYGNGTNRKAIIALVVAILPVVPGFIRAAMTPGGVVPNPDPVRSPLHLRLVRDLRAQRDSLPAADGSTRSSDETFAVSPIYHCTADVCRSGWRRA